MWLIIFSSFLCIILWPTVQGSPQLRCCLDNSSIDDSSIIRRKDSSIHCLNDDMRSCWSKVTNNLRLITQLPRCLKPDDIQCIGDDRCVCCDDGPKICYRSKYLQVRHVGTDGRKTATTVDNPTVTNDGQIYFNNSEVNSADKSTDFNVSTSTSSAMSTNSSLRTTISSTSGRPSASDDEELHIVETNTTVLSNVTTVIDTTLQLPNEVSNVSEHTTFNSDSTNVTKKPPNYTVSPPATLNDDDKINYNYFYILFVIPVIISVGVGYYILLYKRGSGKHDFIEHENTGRRRVTPSWVFSEPEGLDSEDSEEEDRLNSREKD